MRISVICPVFNAKPDLLKAAACSVLTQLGADLELVIVDDRSTDVSTLEAIDEIKKGDCRVKVLHLRQNQGPALARAAGVADASGDWIGFIDADDIWVEGIAGKVTNAIQTTQEIAWLSGNHSIWHGLNVDDAPSILDACQSALVTNGVFLLKSPELTRLLIGNTWLHLGSCFVQTSLIRKSKAFSNDLLYGEDWYFFLKLSLSTPLYFLNVPTYMLRRQFESLTTNQHRLTSARAKANLVAMADPDLKGFRRELRWALYGTYKGIAANNLLMGNRARATLFALKAYLVDPRSISDLARFTRLCLLSDREFLRAKLLSYSRAELFSTHADRGR